MKQKLKTSFVAFLLFSYFSFGQQTQKTDIYNEDFHWTMEIPSNFNKISDEEEEEIYKDGLEIIEGTLGLEVESINELITLAYYELDEFSTFEVNVQPFEKEIFDEFKDYDAYFDAVNEVLIYTMLMNLPGAKFTEEKTVQNLDGQEFLSNKIVFTVEPDAKVYVFICSKVFGDKEFSVNLVYTNENEGQQMMNAMKSSKIVIAND